MTGIPILALDLSTKTGWGLRDRSGQIHSGVQEFELKRGESTGMRFLRFRKWINDVFKLGEFGKQFSEDTPGLVIYEQAHHRGGFATELALGLVTHTQSEAARFGLEYMPVHTATLKKWATGSGKAGKPEMIKKAEELAAGVKLIDDNHADALLLLHYGIDQVGT